MSWPTGPPGFVGDPVFSKGISHLTGGLAPLISVRGLEVSPVGRTRGHRLLLGPPSQPKVELQDIQ